MEVKVSVDGIPRVVCGVTEETTCQEVVIALAQALGQPGRYTLREKFKDFERYMMPNECLLETLEKYGEQAKEVQLALLHSGPSVWDEMSRSKVGRYQPCPPLRRKDAGARMRRRSGSLSVHRQSLPLLSFLRQEAEQPKEDVKRPKRKSLTLMEEAWEWLESLGKGKVYSTASDKESTKKTDKRKPASLDVSFAVDKENLGQSSRSKVRGEKSLKSDSDHQTSLCIGRKTKGKERTRRNSQEAKSNDVFRSSCITGEDEKTNLRETIMYQLSCLEDLKVQIAGISRQISELEEKQRAQRAEQEAQRRMAEELEEIRFWENELKAEEGYEKDLQCQFLEMRVKAVDCKAKLEEYKHRVQGHDFFATQKITEDESKMITRVGAIAAAEFSAEGERRKQPDPDGDNGKFRPRKDHRSPHALVSPNQKKEQRPTGPTELREWWMHWSDTQISRLQTDKKVIHRSELTIYLGSTKV